MPEIGSFDANAAIREWQRNGKHLRRHDCSCQERLRREMRNGSREWIPIEANSTPSFAQTLDRIAIETLMPRQPQATNHQP
jgi:hypothetical protein